MSSQTVAAFTQNDFDCTINGTCFYQECTSNTSAAEANSATAGNVYILGDSIAGNDLVGDDYQKIFSDNQWTANISALSGRHIISGSQSGLAQLDADKSTIANANAIVVALGTNDLEDGATNKARVERLIKKVKQLNTKKAPVYWVNVIDFNNISQSRATNKAIKDAVGGDGTIIDWFTEANSKSTKKFESGYHPNNPADQKLLADLVYKAVSSSGGSTTTPVTKATNGVEFDDKESADTHGQTFIDVDGVDPNPTSSGGYQSGTSYASGRLGSLHTNYFALNPVWAQKNNLNTGDVGALTYKGKTIYAVYGDNHELDGPHAEISVAANMALSGQKNPAKVDNLSGVHFVIYPNSYKQLNNSVDQAKIDRIGSSLFGGAATTENTGECCPDGQSSSPGDSSASSTDVYKFLQALAYQENGGATTGSSGTGAQGKFQYKNDTWQSSAKSYYPPAVKYPTANDAPEAVQDAVTYIEYAVKFKQFNNDLTKIAVSHFYPVANTDPSKMDVTPPDNVITPRQYAKSVIKHMQNDDGKSIQLKQESAPEFKKWYEKSVGAPYAPGSGNTTVASSSGGGACQCPDGSSGVNGDGTVVLDPGHSGSSNTVIDPGTGLKDYDFPNTPEITQVYDVAQKVKTQLEKDGYKVIMTKKSANDTVSFRERAEIANRANAALAVSIHYDDGQPWASMGEVYAQVVGGYRQNTAGMGRGTGKITFKDAAVAAKSKQYADVFAKERTTIEKHNVIVKVNSFDGRSGLAQGNLAMVQLFSKVPWVYNEVGAKPTPLSNKHVDQYAEGLVKSVEKSLGGSGKGNNQSSTTSTDAPGCVGGAASGSIQAAVALAMKYAWPEDIHGMDKKGEYSAANRKAVSKGLYYGGCDGVDCGAFVTRVMQDSGADPSYNKKPGGATNVQEAYIKAHPEKYKSLGTKTSTSGLQAGDIAITEYHTFMYVGPVKDHPAFKNIVASASLCSRAPSSSGLDFNDYKGNPFRWYRLIGGSN